MSTARPASPGVPLALVVTLAALAALAPAALADLDVSVPPNLPLEGASPERVPTQSFLMPERDPDEGDERIVTRVRSAPVATVARPALPAGRTTAMTYARITTVDIGVYIKWRGPIGEGATVIVEKGRPTSGKADGFGAETSAAYPPELPREVYWLVFGLFLRQLLHPNLVSELETLERLVEIGAPALGALADMLTQPWATTGFMHYGGGDLSPRLRLWIEQVKDRIGPLPAGKPRALASSSPREAMKLRLVAEELAGGWAASTDMRLFERILVLPADEAVRLLARYAREDVHPLLRRNAVALLAGYTGAEATAALVGAAGGQDAVVVQRALLALAARGARAELEAIAKARPRGVDQRTLAHVLSAAGSAEAFKPAAKLIKSKDPEEIMLGARALGRCASADPKKAERALAALLKSLARVGAGAFHEKPRVNSDTTDQPGTQLDVLQQLVLIALARAGDAKALERLLGAMEREPAPPPGGQPVIRRNPQASAGTFGLLRVTAWGFAVEALAEAARTDEKARERLRIIATDRVCETGLRVTALRALLAAEGDHRALLEPLLADADAAVKGLALERWAEIDRIDAQRWARQLIGAWSSSSAAGVAEIAAARVLGLGLQERRAAIVTRETDLHERPAPDAKKVGKLIANAGVVVLEQQGDWVRVERGPEPVKVGWVEKKLIAYADRANDEVLADAVKRAAPPKPAADPDPAAPGGGVPAVPGYENPVIGYEQPVLEEIIRELGLLGTDTAREALGAHLADEKQRPHTRALAAIGLGAIGGDAALKTLGERLRVEKEGWVRYAIASAITHHTRAAGVDPDVDWIWGEKAAIDAGVAELAAWVGK